LKLDIINKTLYSKLNECTLAKAFDSVLPNRKRPYIALSDTTSLPWDSKTTKGYEVTATILIYSDYKGDKEINLIAGEIELLFRQKLELGSGLRVIRQSTEAVAIERLGEYREGTIDIKLIIFEEE